MAGPSDKEKEWERQTYFMVRPSFAEMEWETWLEQQPREFAIIIAARTALRFLPFALNWAELQRIEGTKSEPIDPALPLFRTGATVLLAAMELRSRPVIEAAMAVVGDFRHVPLNRHYAAAVYSAAAAVAAQAPEPDAREYLTLSARAIIYASRATVSDRAANTPSARASERTKARFAEAAHTDRAILSEGGSAAELANRPLWLDEAPSKVSSLWKKARRTLLDRNEAFDVWTQWYDDRLAGAPLDIEEETKRALIPGEIWAQEPKAVNAYIKQLSAGSTLKPLNRVRAIFLGHPDAGKTALIRALHGETVVEGDTKMTEGTAITESEPDVFWRERAAEGAKPAVYFWDFGGQVMAHQTHQFFLRSNCVYVIVLDGRRNAGATDAARYWLEHVRAFGDGSPVLIVGNKADLAQVWVDIEPLKRVYSHIVGFFPISCTKAKTDKKDEFANFQSAFEQQLLSAVNAQAMLTEGQMQVIDALRKTARSESFLSRQDFTALCSKHGIGKGNKGLDEDQLLDILDTLGVVVHFKGLRTLDTMLLSPEWLTRGVYTILYSDVANAKQGRLRFDDVLAALAAKPVLDKDGQPLRFDRERTQFIVEAMRRFKLCYRLPEDEDQIIIPALLATDEPQDHQFDLSKSWSFRFLFEGLMPQHVLPSLIVDRHSDIAQGGNPLHDLVWKLGVVLRPPAGSYEASAFVEMVENNRTLTISVTGRHGDDYLGVLRESVRRSLAKMPHLVVHEQVALTPEMRLEGPGAPASEIEWAPFQQVQEILKSGQADYVGPSGRRYSLRLINPRLPAPGSTSRVLIQVDEAVGAQPRTTSARPATFNRRKHIRVFLASPGDVPTERELARELIQNVLPNDHWFKGRITLELVSWDDPHSSTPMPAHLDPQEAISRGLARPSECDVVIAMLWSWMGTPLPPKYKKPDGTRYHSGTEWEFEDALSRALETDGKPMVLLYRRTEKPKIDLDDAEFPVKREHYRLVGQFFDRLRNPDGSIRCSAEPYGTPEQFRIKAEQHMHHYARRLLDGPLPGPGEGVPGVVEATRETYRGIDRMPLDERARALARLRELLDALEPSAVAASTDEVRTLLQTLEQILPERGGSGVAGSP